MELSLRLLLLLLLFLLLLLLLLLLTLLMMLIMIYKYNTRSYTLLVKLKKNFLFIFSFLKLTNEIFSNCKPYWTPETVLTNFYVCELKLQLNKKKIVHSNQNPYTDDQLNIVKTM